MVFHKKKTRGSGQTWWVGNLLHYKRKTEKGCETNRGGNLLRLWCACVGTRGKKGYIGGHGAAAEDARKISQPQE